MKIIKNKVLKLSIICVFLFSVTVSNAGIFSGLTGAFKSGKFFASKKQIARQKYKKFATVIGAVGVGAFIIGSLFFINKWNKSKENFGNNGAKKPNSDKTDLIKKYFKEKREKEDIKKVIDVLCAGHDGNINFFEFPFMLVKKDLEFLLGKNVGIDFIIDTIDTGKIIVNDNTGLKNVFIYDLINHLLQIKNFDLFKKLVKKIVSRHELLELAIECASWHLNLDCIKYLIDNNCTKGISLKESENGLSYEEEQKKIKIIKYLIDIFDLNGNKDKNSNIVKAIGKNKNFDLFMLLMEKIGNNKEYLQKVMDIACSNLNLEITKYLIREKKLEVNLSKVLSAIERGDHQESLNFVKYLIENGICSANQKFNLPCNHPFFTGLGLRNHNAGYGKYNFCKFIYIALNSQNFELMKYLLENGVVICDETEVDLLDCITGGFSMAMKEPIRCLVDNGLSIEREKTYFTYKGFGLPGRFYGGEGASGDQLNELLHIWAKKRDDLYEAVISLDDAYKKVISLGSSYNDTDYCDIGHLLTKINNNISLMFSDNEVPLYAKQTVITGMIELLKEYSPKMGGCKVMISLHVKIMELCKKIEFNYTFLNDPSFKVAVEFAQEHNLMDINKMTVLTAQLARLDNKKVANVFEKNGPLQAVLANRTENLLPEQEGAKVSYENALKYLVKEKNKKRLIDLENARIVARNFSEKTCPDAAFKIIGYTGIDFGNKVDGNMLENNN